MFVVAILLALCPTLGFIIKLIYENVPMPLNMVLGLIFFGLGLKFLEYSMNKKRSFLGLGAFILVFKFFLLALIMPQVGSLLVSFIFDNLLLMFASMLLAYLFGRQIKELNIQLNIWLWVPILVIDFIIPFKGLLLWVLVLSMGLMSMDDLKHVKASKAQELGL